MAPNEEIVHSANLGDLPEDQRTIIRSSIGRIRDIANSLSGSTRLTAHHDFVKFDIEAILIAPVVDMLVTEKRLEFASKGHVTFEYEQSRESYGLAGLLEVASFKRVISNVLNNSVESIKHRNGLVRIRVGSTESGFVAIAIEDNGEGMDPVTLSKIGKRGASFKKSGGSGLGLAHAVDFLSRSGGSIDIQSAEGEGTIVKILVPKTDPPEWFVHRIKIKPGTVVVVFDDDLSIHQIWRSRLDSLNLSDHGIVSVHLSSVDELKGFFKEHYLDLNTVQFFIDYEISDSLGVTGLDLVEEFGIVEASILVTSRYEDPEIIDRCRAIHLKLIPKPMSGFVPIEVV